MTDSDENPILDAIAEEFLERTRRGGRPTIDDYVARHPELEQELQELLPTLQFLEDFKPKDQDRGGQPEPEPEPPAAKLERVGEYRILKEIGRGGMGVVYEAEQLSLGRHVALKVLPRRSSGDETAIERFQREARAAAQLQHPNIVPIIDIGSDDDISYYAMQFVRGRSLHEVQDDVRKLRARSSVPAAQTAWPAGKSDRIDTSTMGGRHYWRSIARIGVQICRALAYAHGRGVIHRDIKPSNLLLDEEGTVWVTDFGLAKTDDEGLTITGDFVGTLRFMSPERFKGQCDERADVFSVGATLYELLVLEPAFHSPDRLHLIQRISKEDPRSLRSIDPGVPTDLETIVLKSLEKDPRRRYQSAEELGADLTRFLDHQPVQARRIGAIGRALRWAARNRALATTATCLIALLIGVAVTAAIVAVQMRGLATDATTARASVERQLYRSQMQSAADALTEGRLELARQLLAEAPASIRGWEWRHLDSQLDRSVRSPVPDRLHATDCLFSPDGARVLTREYVAITETSERRWRTYATDTWKLLCELPEHTQHTNAVLLADGRRVATTGTKLELWNAETGKRLAHVDEPVRFVVELDGRGLLTGTNASLQLRERNSLEVLDSIEEPPWSATVASNPDRIIVTFERRIGVFDPGTLEELPGGLPLPEAGYLLGCTISPSAKMLAVQGAAGSLYLFELIDGRLQNRRDLSGYIGTPTVTTFSSDGEHVLLGTNTGHLYAWDTTTGSLAHQLHGHTATINTISTDPGTAVAITCDNAGTDRGWSLHAESIDELRGHSSFVYAVAFSRDGSRLVSGGWDGFRHDRGSLRWWDARTGTPITARLEPQFYVTDVACAAGDRVVAAVQANHGPLGAFVYDELNGNELLHFKGHGNDTVNCIAMHPDGNRVVTVGLWEWAILWHIDTGEIERKWRIEGDGTCTRAALSPDGRWLAHTVAAGRIALIDLEQDRSEHRWTAHADYITQLSFTQDSRTLLSSSQDDSVGVWNLDGSPRGRLHGHGIDVMCVAASPHGDRIATGGRDGHLLLWDAQHLDLVARLTGHRDYIFDLAWSPDGNQLITTSGDGTLRMWTTERLTARSRERHRRSEIVNHLEPQLRAARAAGATLRQLADRWRGDAERSERERQIAHQLLIGLPAK